jgi:hypothetical protein
MIAPLALLRMPISAVSNLSADDRIDKRNDNEPRFNR